MARTRGEEPAEKSATIALADIAAATETIKKAHMKKESKKRKAQFDDRAPLSKRQLDDDAAYAALMHDKSKDADLPVAQASEKELQTVSDSSEWDVKFPGQRFGQWSTLEVEQMKRSLEKWANEHGLAEDFMNGNYEFLFNHRQKQGGKGAHLPLSERRAFIEVARETPTRNAKQIYGWILRNMDKKSKSGKWQKEETEALLEQYTKLGPKWSKIAEIVGRPASACRDKWRLAKGGEHKKSGHWSQEETDKLCELVKEHFRQRGAEAGCGPGTGNEHLSLRDNINWVTISAKMGTRNEQACLQRWYQISPPMTSTGEWDVEQDYEMLNNVIKYRSMTAEAVPWASTVRGRDLSRIMRRWKLLSSKISGHVDMAFRELVLQVCKSKDYKDLVIKAQALVKSSSSA